MTYSYQLPKESDVSITVYDVLGRNVWNHVETDKPAGHYSLMWKGVNDTGQLQASGVYLISFSTPGFNAVQKVLLLR